MSLEDNFIDHNFLTSLNEDHDILDEFLDQRVYDSIGTNTPVSGNVKAESDDMLLDNLYQENKEYLYVDPSVNQFESTNNSVYASPVKSESSHQEETYINNSSIIDYDFVRDELSKLKFGNPFMNPCPETLDVPSSYLDFSPQAMAALPYKLDVLNLPSYSRVETQIKLKFSLSPPPPHLLLHIPQDLISKNKFCLSENVENLSPKLKESLLFMDAYVLTSDLEKSCNICVRCIKREQRRASRRKVGGNDDPADNNNYGTPAPAAGAVKNNPNSWADETMMKKAIIFNCKEMVSFPPPNGLNNDSSKALEVSARIICYCRHHKEGDGFVLLFVLKNYKGEVVAKQLSSPIMIMDRKKNTTNKFESKTSSVVGSSTNLKELNQDDSDEYDAKHSYFPDTHNNSITTPQDRTGADILDTVHPLSPNSIDESASDPHTNTDTSDARGTKRKKLSIDDSFNTSTNPMFNGSVNGFSPVSNSDTNTSTSHNLMIKQKGSFSQFGLSSIPQQPSDPQQNLPSIQRIIPAQGPIRGGIEVTLLGFNFRPGLNVKFGANQALATHCWSETTIVTYLPPAAQPGQVLVSFEDQEVALYGAAQQQQIFTYTDDTDRQLIELALQIVGLKMNGKLEDAKNIAKRIVGSDTGANGGSSMSNGISSGSSSIQNSMNQANIDWYDNAHKAVQQLSKSGLSTEEILINFLSLVDLPNCPIIIPNWQLCNNQGQTLLHLSTLKKYSRMIKFLITHGCKIDVQDNQGITPLFLASMSGNRDLIQVFVERKSNWSLKLSNDKYLKDYCDLNVLDVFEKLENGQAAVEAKEELGKSLSFDSLNSMFTGSYGRHISKMVMQDEFENPSGGEKKMREENQPLSMYESSNYSSEYADSEYESNEGYSTGDYEDDYEDDEADDESVIDVLRPSSGGDTESVNTIVAGSSSETDEQSALNSGLWQKVKNVFNNDDEDPLPSYDDLFPFGPSSFHSKPKTSIERSLNEDSKDVLVEGSSAGASVVEEAKVVVDEHDDGIASDSSEDMVISFINHPRKTVENDKMLLFFWFPVLVCILGLFFMVSVMGYRIEMIESIKIYVRDTIGNLMVGDERIMTVFKNNNGRLVSS